MKFVAITMMFISSMSSYAQPPDFEDIPTDILQQLDNMGIDGSPLLNNYEGAYLNVIFSDSLKGFDIAGKKVGFIQISGIPGKQEYFNQVKVRFHRNEGTIGGTGIYIFDAAQKAESGGYDAAIVYWSKFIVPIEDIIKRLKS